MIDSQKKFGKEKIKTLSKRWVMSEKDVVCILHDAKEVKAFFNWVNASDFIEEEMSRICSSND